MQREEKSERSRRLVLDAALRLFSHQGFRGTSVREVAETAGVSIGNVYHHFPDKESIFNTLLAEYWATVEDRRFPFMRELTSGKFPDNIEQLGFAARDSVRQSRRHIALIYVDVIEFEGTHIRKFYGDMAQRLKTILEDAEITRIQSRLRPGVSPISALMLTTRFFFNYFSVEILFGVPEPFGKDSATMVAEIGDILRNGMVS